MYISLFTHVYIYLFILYLYHRCNNALLVHSFNQISTYIHALYIYIHWPCYCILHMYVVTHFVWQYVTFLSGSESVQVFFLSFICIYIHCICTVVGDPIIKREEGRRGRDRMVVGFTTTYAIGAYHHWCCKFESRSRRGVQHYEMKFFSDWRHVGGFLQVLRFPPPIKLTATI